MKGRLVPRAALTQAQHEAMFALLAGQFVTARRDVFEADLAGKNWVLLLEDPRSGALRGFTTLLHYRARPPGGPVQVVYSGDTVVESSAMGSPALSRDWIGAVNRLRGDDPAPLYWLLIVSGCRTYNFLPVFWRDFHPRFDVPMPPAARVLRDALAIERFGDRFDPVSGVVRLARPQVLREDLRCIPPGRLADPHVAFFTRANPGYVHGDELVCLTELARDNLTSAGRRMWDAAARAPAGSGGAV